MHTNVSLVVFFFSENLCLPPRSLLGHAETFEGYRRGENVTTMEHGRQLDSSCAPLLKTIRWHNNDRCADLDSGTVV
jgi:hypothetical protein